MWVWIIAFLVAVLLWWHPSLLGDLASTGQRWCELYLRRVMFQSACGNARMDPENGLRLHQLDDNDIDWTIHCLRKMLEVPEMKSVHLNWSDLSQEAFLKIWAEALHIETWSFQGCKLGFDQWSEAGNMALHPLRHSKVRVLHASDCAVTSSQLHEVAQDFGRPLSMTAMEMTQKVKRTMTPDRSLAWNLSALNLSINPLTGAGRSLQTLMRSLPTLSALVLMRCELTQEDVDQIAKALPRSNLYYLELAQNELGSQGLFAITRTLASSKLQSLGLERNEIGPGDALNELKLAHDKRPFPHLKLKKNRLSPTELKAFEDSLKKVYGDFCPPGCRCFEGRGEVM